jgi:hypothetical protein
VCKQKSEDYIVDMCNGVEQLQLDRWLGLVQGALGWTDGLDDSKGALKWTGGLDKFKGALGWTSGLDKSKEALGVD